MRPDRLIVGEVREAESLDLLIALNSGLPGNANEALNRLCRPPLRSGAWQRFEKLSTVCVLSLRRCCGSVVGLQKPS